MGAYPKDIYEKLFKDSKESYDDYWARTVSHFTPHEASPYNNLLPANWQETKNRALQQFYKKNTEIAPASMNPLPTTVFDKSKLLNK